MGYKGVLDHNTHPSRRDTRIDVFRSLALLTIFINHIPGTVYTYLTHKNFGFSDATEIFVLLSWGFSWIALSCVFTSGGIFYFYCP